MDTDLTSVQEARDLARNARTASAAFAELSEKEAKRIAAEVAKVCVAQAERYAQLAVAETGIGNIPDKVAKNLLASRDLVAFYKDTQLGGVRKSADGKLVELARPAGVVVGLVPSTSPVATLYFKALICLMSRNALILSPHPLARSCSIDACDTLAEAAVRAGAPRHAIQIQRELTLDATTALMRLRDVDLILATGGGPMVRAAYSSGTPAIGVGPGNAPVYVDRSAQLDKAAKDLIDGKAFDNGSICSAPSVIVCHKDVQQGLTRHLQDQGAHICAPEQQKLLEAFTFPGGKFNTKIVGKSASWLAERSGFAVSPKTRILVTSLSTVDAKTPMAKEKLSPIIAMIAANDFNDALRIGRAVLAVSGAGHTAGIHAQEEKVVMAWASGLDVNRIVVNNPTTHGTIGIGTPLAPSLTLGTGFSGRSSSSENIGPQHLINWKRIAYPLSEKKKLQPESSPASAEAVAPSQSEDLKVLVDAIVEETLAYLSGKERQ